MSDPSGHWPSWNDVGNFFKKAVVAVVKVRAEVKTIVNRAVSEIFKPNPITYGMHTNVRTALNNNLPQTEKSAVESYGYTKMKEKDSKFHQNSKKDNKPNSKYISPDGKKEVVYYSDGSINNNPKDIGTYNFIPSGTFWEDIGHGLVDVAPYMIWGNNEEDTTNIFDRVIMIFK